MTKYTGLDYNPRTRETGTLDRVSLDKNFMDEHPERDKLLRDIVERLNYLISNVWAIKTREAHDWTYTDANGIQRNIGDMLDDLALGSVNVVMLVDPDDNELTDPNGNTLTS